MKNFKKSDELIRQNEQIAQKSQKHDVNLQKNSTLYFQIGLIVCLMFAYGLLEMNFETTVPTVPEYAYAGDDFSEAPTEVFKIYEAPKVKVEPEPLKKTLLTDKVEIVDNDHQMKKAEEIITGEQNTTSKPVLNPGDVIVVDEIEEAPVDFKSVEIVPIYPGCEKKKTNAAKRKCMSDKITKLVQRKFDGNLAGELGLSGKQVIRTQFKIDKYGHVTDIKTRGTHPKLENEAERVINKIPEMTPGKQRDKNVGVIYSLPIVFQVNN